MYGIIKQQVFFGRMFKKRQIKSKSEKRKLESDDEADTGSAGGKLEVLESPLTVPVVERNSVSNTMRNSVVKKQKLDKPEPLVATSLETQATPLAVTGPLKAIPKNIKTTTIVDFQPDVCKDFLQTGYCGYGDTCKFLHVRNELKQKKVIAKEWETTSSSQKSEQAKPDSQPFPFKCVLCKKDYVSPVQVSCGHVFCQKCFMARSKKNQSCTVCGKDTGGVCKPILSAQLAKLIES